MLRARGRRTVEGCCHKERHMLGRCQVANPTSLNIMLFTYYFIPKSDYTPLSPLGIVLNMCKMFDCI